MSRRGLAILSALAFIGLVALPALSHPPSVTNEAARKAVIEEIMAFRKELAATIAAKNATRLREMYAPSFVHTHTSAKTDNRDARIVAALAGDPVIEDAPATELVIRVPNDWTAIATGISPIVSMADKKTYAVRWTAVYARTTKGWELAASHATRSHEIK